MDTPTNPTAIEPSTQAPTTPSTAFTGGQKAGWFFVGMFGGVVGVLMASLCNVNHPDRATATKMALIGLASWVAIFVLIFFLATCATAMFVTSIATAYY